MSVSIWVLGLTNATPLRITSLMHYWLQDEINPLTFRKRYCITSMTKMVRLGIINRHVETTKWQAHSREYPLVRYNSITSSWLHACLQFLRKSTRYCNDVAGFKPGQGVLISSQKGRRICPCVPGYFHIKSLMWFRKAYDVQWRTFSISRWDLKQSHFWLSNYR